ncbi:hypothetical protein ACTMSW_22565 [Micromonospora sp. BQ11]|uniref:hypothetical protein n=1 Tax=Micromonospora sp. BQ11 TaxID=3452212 RepID=UPI003F8B1D57
MSVVPDESAPPDPGRSRESLDLVLRVVGGAFAVLGGLLSAVLELLLAPLRVGGHLIGVAVLVAVGVNLLLGWFAHRTVSRRWAVALPAVPWFLLVAIAGLRTDEGDLLLAGTWVDLGMIVGGAMTFAVVGFRQVLAAPPPPPRLSSPPAP